MLWDLRGDRGVFLWYLQAVVVVTAAQKGITACPSPLPVLAGDMGPAASARERMYSDYLLYRSKNIIIAKIRIFLFSSLENAFFFGS